MSALSCQHSLPICPPSGTAGSGEEMENCQSETLDSKTKNQILLFGFTALNLQEFLTHETNLIFKGKISNPKRGKSRTLCACCSCASFLHL